MHNIILYVGTSNKKTGFCLYLRLVLSFAIVCIDLRLYLYTLFGFILLFFYSIVFCIYVQIIVIINQSILLVITCKYNLHH